MLHRLRRAGALTGACLGLLAPSIPAGPAGAASSPGAYETVVVQLAGPSVDAASVLDAAPGFAAKPANHHRYLMRVPAGEVPALLGRLRSDNRVNYASVAHAVHATASPNDPCYVSVCPPATTGTSPADPTPTDGYLKTIGAPAAWDVTKGDGQYVAVLDSGVDSTNPDLAGKIRITKNDCVENPACADPAGTTAADKYGHGTHVSGIVGAVTNNNAGVASLGWNVGIDMYKVLDSTGSGTDADVVTGIYDAVDSGDRVINMSLANASCPSVNFDTSRCGPDLDEAKAVEYALAHNVVMVAAAGNDGYNSPTYPASYSGVLSVAETNNSGTIRCSSEWGSAANIAAPGLNIPSTWSSEIPTTPQAPPAPTYTYYVDSGTSMSAAVVSAAAALMVAHRPGLSGPQITTLLERTASPTTGDAGCGAGDGYQPPSAHPIAGGLLNVPAALAAESNPPPTRYWGYDLAAADGSVYAFGEGVYLGDASATPLAKPIVGIARRGDGLGYWLAATDGGIFTYGNAGFFGSMGGKPLNKPVVGAAATATGGGYWEDASDGGIFTFGDARFFGSMGGKPLNRPVVGMASTASGGGYWEVASDGGIFTFGDAGFFGSEGGKPLNKPVVAMAATPDGRGYWLVASDGGIFTFGDAGFFGSEGGKPLNRPVVGVVSTPDGGGYWLIASDGGVFTFGDAGFYGSTGGSAIPGAVVGGA